MQTFSKLFIFHREYWRNIEDEIYISPHWVNLQGFSSKSLLKSNKKMDLQFPG